MISAPRRHRDVSDQPMDSTAGHNPGKLEGLMPGALLFVALLLVSRAHALASTPLSALRPLL